ncbi:cytochrome b [Rhodobacteraceae bacterium 2376]|uniref:Cytochrome b n=1 Tax=Rhabdonatronobacter sediminivivens TaxID=2743469 RepID=A0A7Z0HXY0_9RHOB|nr:cytochrome b [Rhabdonatronobacter sediminivivens]NYS23909.1 cytochrome b [Rhabdonatronobacter sediminivivens]
MTHQTPDAGRPPVVRYAVPVRFLHWLVAILIIGTIPIANVMQREGLERATQDLLFILHKNGGVIIFLLVVLRILWRVATPAPPMPATMPGWQQAVAKLAHWGLYAMLLVMTVSGYIRVRAGGFPVEMLDALGVPAMVPRSDSLAETAQAIHSTGRFVLIALILAHVGAAVQHALKRDGVFSRIWPPVGR